MNLHVVSFIKNCKVENYAEGNKTKIISGAVFVRECLKFWDHSSLISVARLTYHLVLREETW